MAFALAKGIRATDLAGKMEPASSKMLNKVRAFLVDEDAGMRKIILRRLADGFADFKPGRKSTYQSPSNAFAQHQQGAQQQQQQLLQQTLPAAHQLQLMYAQQAPQQNFQHQHQQFMQPQQQGQQQLQQFQAPQLTATVANGAGGFDHGQLITVAPFPLGTPAGLARPCLACRHAAHGADDCWTLKPELRTRHRARAAAIAAAGL